MRTRKIRLRRKAPLWVVLISLVLFLIQQLNWFEPAKQAVIPVEPGHYAVTEFVDGDTIEVNMNGVKEKVRMIGVDTPETQDPRTSVQCFGKAAADFTGKLIANHNVRLEADPENNSRDRYNRLLRYVYLPDGKLVNAEIIKQGYGFAYTSFPFTKLEEFKAYEHEAREAKRGLWGACNPQIDNKGYIRSNPED